MHSLLSILRRIPYWAYLLVFLVILVNTIYFIYRYKASTDGTSFIFQNGKCLITSVAPGGPAEKAGLRRGDILLKIDEITAADPATVLNCYDLSQAGDTLTYTIQRSDNKIDVPLILGSIIAEVPGFYQVTYILFILFSIAGLYLLLEKQGDHSVKLFFLYFQFFLIALNGRHMCYHDAVANFANIIFLFSGPLMGAFLVHFHLLFPEPSRIVVKYKRIPLIVYCITILFSVVYSVSYLQGIYSPSELLGSDFGILDQGCVSLVSLTFIIALGIAVYQFITIKSTLARNQLRIVIIGSSIVLITPMTFALAYDFVTYLQALYPFIIDFSMGISGVLMIICLLIAIFRYRIWDVEVIIRKVILYIGTTLVIIITYLIMIWFVDRMTLRMTDFTRFLMLGISVIIFLLLRDRIQQLIDRLFHRETYDSATVVSDFEEKLAGIYHLDELKQKIVQSLDDIFHFKSFVFSLKKSGLSYEPACVIGTEFPIENLSYEINPELEERLQKAKVFSPEELNQKPPILNQTNGELVVPLISDGLPNGFFICGQKKSERMYSLQDISILSLLARRVIALLHTASLYQKDLDRQLMLERERARISQDMHDDIGAGLTKIAMISEAPVKSGDKATESGERMARVASSAREMISRLNVIVWALNPKNDNLDSLIAYSRRYFGEYLENVGISFITDTPDSIPGISLSPDTRRNIFYVMQEAIHNAVKHGACTEVSFSVSITGQDVEIVISDNGKGFDTGKPGISGNGLINMKKRADDLGGSVNIKSSPGEGTEIEFSMPLQQNTTKG
jgi:signal transduction histidine kinase